MNGERQDEGQGRDHTLQVTGRAQRLSGAEQNTKAQFTNEGPTPAPSRSGEITGEASQHSAPLLANYHCDDRLLLNYAHPQTPDIP